MHMEMLLPIWSMEIILNRLFNKYLTWEVVLGIRKRLPVLFVLHITIQNELWITYILYASFPDSFTIFELSSDADQVSYQGIPEMAQVAVPVAPTGINSATQTGSVPSAISGAPNSSPLNLFPQVFH